MSSEYRRPRPSLLVLASTYPRWREDPEPGFVHELCRRLTDSFNVIAVVPSAPAAAAYELLDGVHVYRFRYAPRGLETLVNDGGIVANIRRSPWKLLLLPCFLLGQAWLAARLIRRFDVAIIHAHWLIPQGLVAACLGPRRLPVVVTSHGADLFALRGRAFRLIKTFVVRRAAALTVVSAAMRHELERLGAEVSKVQVEPMGVDLQDRFTPSDSVERSEIEILFVGRLVEKKGVRHLIEAMPAILERHPQARLTIAGFGPEEATLRQHMHTLGLAAKIDFIGAVPQQQLPLLYRRAAVFVAPFVQARDGDQEGLGLVMIEAVGCGCPLLVSDLPAVHDVIMESRCRVAPGEPGLLSAAICRVLAEPAEARALAASVRSRVEQRFDWRHVAARYRQLLSGLAGMADVT